MIGCHHFQLGDLQRINKVGGVLFLNSSHRVHSTEVKGSLQLNLGGGWLFCI